MHILRGSPFILQLILDYRLREARLYFSGEGKLEVERSPNRGN
jgi:hypothetical protein